MRTNSIIVLLLLFFARSVSHLDARSGRSTLSSRPKRGSEYDDYDDDDKSELNQVLLDILYEQACTFT